MVFPHSSSNPAPQIVIVNDSAMQLRMLCGLLQQAGFEPASFSDTDSALAALLPTAPPALIVTGLYMPGLDGWNFCRLLRSPAYAPFNHVPILVVSSTFAGDESARLTADLGANAFLPMPVAGELFIETVRTLLKGDRPREASRVLLVEPSPVFANRLQLAFQAHGYEVEAAFTWQEAFARITGGPCDVAVLADQCQEWAQLHAQVQATRASVTAETVTPIQGGQPQYFEVVLNPMYDDSGAVTAIAGTTRDINARKQAEAKIHDQRDELRRWHGLTLGREARILELKHEINRLLTELCRPARFANVEEPSHA